jgi:hypothetical protein
MQGSGRGMIYGTSKIDIIKLYTYADDLILYVRRNQSTTQFLSDKCVEFTTL